MERVATSGPDKRAELCREHARAQLQRGDLAQAEQAFQQLLALLPADVEALCFVADRQLARDQHALALDTLQAALQANPDSAPLLHQLGATQLAAGAFAAAALSLRGCLRQQPRAFLARLRLGIALEQLQQPKEALLAYYGAIRQAQLQGRWLNDATTAPALREVVQYAMRYVNDGRARLFSELLKPLRQRHGASELVRVEHCLAVHLGQQALEFPDARQQPKFLYFPGVPSQPFYPHERFPWLETLEAATATVRAELRAVLEQASLEAFLGEPDSAATTSMLRGESGRAAAWDAYFFHRHGKHYDDHRARCPQTTRLLDALPLVHIRDHAPEALFSVLRPGTHILPHRGVTNTRLVTHLPLIVPRDCALRVGGEIHEWQEGRCVTFDDTFEHEAWNRSDQTRVVLILDSWNPDLTEVERLAVTALVEAIGDFNQACDETPADA